MQTDGDEAGWRELFVRLGVRDGLIIRKQRQTLSAAELVRTNILIRHRLRTHTRTHSVRLKEVQKATQ